MDAQLALAGTVPWAHSPAQPRVWTVHGEDSGGAGVRPLLPRALPPVCPSGRSKARSVLAAPLLLLVP